MPNPAYIAKISTQGANAANYYGSWKTLQIRRQFLDAITVFSFSASENTKGTARNATFLKPGDAVAISLGSHQVVNGYVTKREVSYDKESHDLIVQGKSKTCDVVDSSVIIKPGDYKGYNVQQIANAVMQPHGVQMVMRNPPSGWDRAFDWATPHYGETCHSFINRLCNQRGLLMTDDENGNLVAGQGSSSAAAVANLVEDKNILRAVGVLDDENAWSTTGMIASSPGTDQNWGTTRAVAASVTNPGLTRPNRVRLVHGDMTGDASQLATRTGFENIITSSTIVQASVTVAGWFKPDGTLWTVGDNLTVLSPMLFPMVDGPVSLSVKGVTYSQDQNEGTTTTLDLVQPQFLGSPIDPGAGSPPSTTGASGGGGSQPEAGPTTSGTPSAPDTPLNDVG